MVGPDECEAFVSNPEVALATEGFAGSVKPLADEPFLPDYTGPCVTNVAAAVQHPPDDVADWVPRPVAEAEQSSVLLVIDGLG